MLMSNYKAYKILLLIVDITHNYILVFMWLNGNEIICYYLSYKLLRLGVQNVYIHHANIHKYSQIFKIYRHCNIRKLNVLTYYRYDLSPIHSQVLRYRKRSNVMFYTYKCKVGRCQPMLHKYLCLIIHKYLTRNVSNIFFCLFIRRIR